jgi:hypothetical protein
MNHLTRALRTLLRLVGISSPEDLAHPNHPNPDPKTPAPPSWRNQSPAKPSPSPKPDDPSR